MHVMACYDYLAQGCGGVLASRQLSAGILFDCAVGNPGYSYTEDLLALDWCIGRAVLATGDSTVWDPHPLNVEAWIAMLSQHPDQ